MGILVLGSTVLDIIASAERLPLVNETILASSYTLSPGGKGANQAIAARTFGAEVSFISAIGTDVFSELSIVNLVSQGVYLKHLEKRSGQTAVGVLQSAVTGELLVMLCNGVLAEVTASGLPEQEFERHSIFITQSELPTQTTIRALELARAHQCRVVFNYAPVNDIPLPALVGLNFIVVNEIESVQLAKKLGIAQIGYPDMCMTFGRILDTTAVVTLGSKGAFAFWEGTLYHVPTAQVGNIDPTGAGDAFCGILAASLHEGYDVLSALRLASVGGAIACTRHGAQNAFTSKSEIERLAEVVPLPYVYDSR